MSLSVNSSANNPYLQSLLQQFSTASPGQSDPLSALFAALDQSSAPAGGTADASNGAAATASATGSGAQLSPQTLQALFQLQANDGQSQAGGVDDSDDAGQTQQPQISRGHHHHRHGGGGLEGLLQMLDASASGATSQTTTNSNGSSTIAIDYSDGSSIAMTTPAAGTASSLSSSGSGTPDNSGTTGAAAIAGNNLLEQLIAMQAQLLNTSTPQSIVSV
jgi:hypothetical protein